MDGDFVLTIPNWVPLAVLGYLLIGAAIVAVHNTVVDNSARWGELQSFCIALFWLPIALFWIAVAGIGALGNL